MEDTQVETGAMEDTQVETGAMEDTQVEMLLFFLNT